MRVTQYAALRVRANRALFPASSSHLKFICLKIALAILHADPARGGAERYTVDLHAGLRARGHEACIISSSFAEGPLPVGSVSLAARSATRLGRYQRFIDALHNHISETRYDVVHAMLPVHRCDVYHPHAGIAAETIAGGHLKYDGAVLRMLALTANRMNRKRGRFAAVERAMLNSEKPPVVLLLSQYVGRNFRRHYPSEQVHVATLFNGVDLVRFDPAHRPEARGTIRARYGILQDRIVGLMIAQDFERKGLREAILATAHLKDEPLTLLVVGKQNPEPYRRVAEREGVADRVIFAGTTKDPYAFYRAADFFVLPTRHDPCSLVVLESLAMGVPVISTVCNGACEIMTDGTHGFVLSDPADPAPLAAAMRNLLDQGTRASMAAACLELRQALSYEKHLDELLRIYSTLPNRVA